MSDNVQKVGHLIIKYWRQELDEEELDYLIDWANQSRANRETFNKLTDPDFMVGNLKELSNIKQNMRDRIWAELEAHEAGGPRLIKIKATPPVETPVQEVPRVRKISWSRVAVAASLLLAIGVLVYKLPGSKNKQPVVSETGDSNTNPDPDAALKQYSAGSIRFHDGKEVDLSTIPDDEPFRYGGLSLIRQNGIIRVLNEANPLSADTALFASIQTPNRGAYVVELQDGSRVSLNAASSVSFPVVFSPHKRVVEMKGEAFFDVEKAVAASGNRIPFFVYNNRMKVEVLGTRFNMNVYPEQKLARTTLEEGLVKVWKQDAKAAGSASQDPELAADTLLPGQQAQVSDQLTGGSMGIRVDNVSVKDVLSWKEGVYSYSDITWELLMAQLTRWFDAKFEYPKGISGLTFSGIIFRKDGLATTLHDIEGAGRLAFELKANNTVFVKIQN